MSNEHYIKQSNKDKRAFWSGHIQRWKESGLSQALYCQQESVKLSTFCYWKTVLAPKPRSSSFLPVTVIPTIEKESHSAIKIKMPAGHEVSIPCSLGPNEIATYFRLLGVSHA